MGEKGHSRGDILIPQKGTLEQKRGKTQGESKLSIVREDRNARATRKRQISLMRPEEIPQVSDGNTLRDLET